MDDYDIEVLLYILYIATSTNIEPDVELEPNQTCGSIYRSSALFSNTSIYRTTSSIFSRITIELFIYKVSHHITPYNNHYIC